MHRFHIPHALLVILIVSQISVGLSNEQVEEITTLDPATNDSTYQSEPTDDVDEHKITRRFRFKRPPASAYQPTKHKKPKHLIQELPPPPPPPPQYEASWPAAPVETPMAPPMQVAIPLPLRPIRPRPRPIPIQPPAPSLGEFLPSAISGLTNMLTGGRAPPGGGGLGPLGDLLGPLSGFIKPAMSMLGPLSKALASATPFGKTILDLFSTIQKIINFFSDFSLPKFLGGLFSCVPRIMNAICGAFGFIPRMIDRLCRLLGNIFKMVPKTLMLIPKFFECLHKLPERMKRCIDALYRFCYAMEMFLAFLKQALWNMLRLLGNTVLLPLRIISKTVAEVIHLPIKLLSEPFFAFVELMRAILYPFRKLYHFLLSRLEYIVEEIHDLLIWLFGTRSREPAVAILAPSRIPLIRVFPAQSRHFRPF